MSSSRSAITRARGSALLDDRAGLVVGRVDVDRADAAGRLYHYTIVVNFDARGIGSIDIGSPDDETGTVVEKR